MGCCHCLSSACNASWGRVWVLMSSINATELFALLCSLWATPTAALGMGVAHTRSSDKHFSRDLPLSSSLAVLHWAGCGSHTHTHSSCKLCPVTVVCDLQVPASIPVFYNEYGTRAALLNTDHDLALSLLVSQLLLVKYWPCSHQYWPCSNQYCRVYSVVLPLAVLYVTWLYEAREDYSAEVCYAIFYSPKVCLSSRSVCTLQYTSWRTMLVKYSCAHECPSYACLQTHHTGLHTILYPLIMWCVCVWTHSSVTMIP